MTIRDLARAAVERSVLYGPPDRPHVYTGQYDGHRWRWWLDGREVPE